MSIARVIINPKLTEKIIDRPMINCHRESTQKRSEIPIQQIMQSTSKKGNQMIKAISKS